MYLKKKTQDLRFFGKSVSTEALLLHFPPTHQAEEALLSSSFLSNLDRRIIKGKRGAIIPGASLILSLICLS